MAKTITLKFPGVCADDQGGASLSVGDKGRWYGRGRVYGIGCHDKMVAKVVTDANVDLQWVVGRGAVQGNGMCEDAPACGCCGPELGMWEY